MSANSFGHLFKITSFGESHGEALGVVVEGCPAGVVFDFSTLQGTLAKRRPGARQNVSQRNEDDAFEILSGVFENKTLGTPICVIVRNRDARSSDYSSIKNQARVGHADDVWLQKFQHTDYRGGGRSSGRETVSRVIGGAIAEMFLKSVEPRLQVLAWPRSIGTIHIEDSDIELGCDYNLTTNKRESLNQYLTAIRESGDSVGGIIELQINNVPTSLGQPVFHKLKADLASAMMSIGATSGFALGDGFHLANQRGTEVHTGHETPYGGIRGGLSTGEPVRLQVAFKPTSSILDVAKKGRHDPCIVLRALPVVESMAWLVLADHYLWKRLDHVEL